MSDQGQLAEVKATLHHWDAMYAQHGLAPLPPAVAAQESARHVNRAQIDWLVAEIERLRALLEPTVTMTCPHVTDPGFSE
jgi:hypothetical protein